ncbi:carboxymuconolactone decarboxylase family protein, partial [Micromonospora purpureochromogenes]|uniref:carboxymuconolactone decarboxylase family protein n=1 Tax=Micromonospora purpureochromogenes TaxID=47872 RepID=UPI003322C05A
MSVFTAHTPETAPAAARPTMAGVQRRLGHLPEAVARMAESPELLKGFLTANATFESTDLDPVEREVVVLTVATRNECHVCVAMHTATLTRHGADPALTPTADLLPRLTGRVVKGRLGTPAGSRTARTGAS